jgi:DNA-directed RNA polymerase specialized sigma24 family protein
VAAPPDPSHPAVPPFDRWVAARAPALSRFAYVLTGSAAEADVVVQQALVSARLRWARLARAPDLDIRVQTLVVRAYLRRRRSHGATSGGTGADEAWLPAAGATDEPDERSAQVWRRCARLSPRQRATLVLACREDLTAAEVAAVTGGRRGTAAAEARAALRRVLPDVGDPATRRAEVRRALERYADSAPQAYAPAERAVASAQRRRRGHVAAAAALAAALAVPAAWGLSRTDPTPVEPAAPGLVADGPGWRWESWGGVQVRVPRDWGHGDLTQWCVAQGPSGPAVDRPELDSTHALCSLYDDGRPTYTGGLLLRRADEPLRLSRGDVAPYATTRIHTVGNVTLTVVDIDPAVGSAILASAEVVGRRDANGCPPRLGPAPGSGDLAAVVDADAVSVCRYGLTGWDRPTLVSSRRLVDQGADDVLHAVRHAPPGPPTRAGARCRGAAEELATLVLWDDDRPTTAVVRYDGCRRHGLADGVGHRRLTGEVLAQIMVPPWTGTLTPDVQRAMAPHGEHPDPEDSIRPVPPPAPGGQLVSGTGAAAR